MCDHTCPVMTSLNAADKMLDEFGDIHEEPDVNRGVIAIQRRLAEIVQGVHPCTGPVAGQDGLVRCPLAGIIGDSSSLAAYRAAPTVIPAEKVIAAERTRATGQYL